MEFISAALEHVTRPMRTLVRGQDRGTAPPVCRTHPLPICDDETAEEKVAVNTDGPHSKRLVSHPMSPVSPLTPRCSSESGGSTPLARGSARSSLEMMESPSTSRCDAGCREEAAACGACLLNDKVKSTPDGGRIAPGDLFFIRRQQQGARGGGDAKSECGAGGHGADLPNEGRSRAELLKRRVSSDTEGTGSLLVLPSKNFEEGMLLGAGGGRHHHVRGQRRLPRIATAVGGSPQRYDAAINGASVTPLVPSPFSPLRTPHSARSTEGATGGVPFLTSPGNSARGCVGSSARGYAAGTGTRPPRSVGDEAAVAPDAAPSRFGRDLRRISFDGLTPGPAPAMESSWASRASRRSDGGEGRAVAASRLAMSTTWRDPSASEGSPQLRRIR